MLSLTSRFRAKQAIRAWHEAEWSRVRLRPGGLFKTGRVNFVYKGKPQAAPAGSLFHERGLSERFPINPCAIFGAGGVRDPASGPVWSCSQNQGVFPPSQKYPLAESERQLFIGNLLFRVHFIIEMIWKTGLASWEFEFVALHQPSYGRTTSRTSNSAGNSSRSSRRPRPSPCAIFVAGGVRDPV